MKQETFLLKLAILVLGIPIFLFSIFGVNWLANHPANPEYAFILYPIVIGIYVTLIPFYIALHNASKLLNYINQNIILSALSVSALKKIKYCAFTISALYVVMLPFVYFIADKDDAPGLFILGWVPIFASVVIALFVGVLQKLLKNAIDIKLENNLMLP